MNTREYVIRTLEKEKGRYVSGEALAKSCKVSRNAIWKTVAELRKEGFPIRSVRNRGYMLEPESDVLSKAGICLYLQKSGMMDTGGGFREDRILVFDELDSTSSEAKRSLLFESGHFLHKTVIAAKRQNAGRGHGGSSFSSPDGGIYFSIILEPEKLEKAERSLPEQVSAAVLSVLERILDIKLKKEKDSSIYAGNEKICGILTEGICDLETGQYSNYIIGIGIHAGKMKAFGDVPPKNAILAEILKELAL